MASSVAASTIAAVHVAAVLLDHQVRGDEPYDLGDLHLHFGEGVPALGAFGVTGRSRRRA